MDLRINTKSDKEAVKAYIDSLPEGKRYNVIIKQHREKRSVDQNRLYWFWLARISDETGQDRVELHEYFATKFIGSDRKLIREVEIVKPRSTTSLDTAQFTEYLERINAFASAELGIVLPNPEDKFWDFFYEKYKDKV